MITIKKAKIFPRMSEETTAFVALVFWNGSLLGEATNDGHGGCSYLRFDPKMKRDDLDAADAFARQQPVLDEKGQQMTLAGGKPMFYSDAADYAGHLAEEQEWRKANERKLDRLLKTDIVFTIEGTKGLWVKKKLPWSEGAKTLITAQEQKRHGAGTKVVFLNEMPREAALEHFLANAQ